MSDLLTPEEREAQDFFSLGHAECLRLLSRYEATLQAKDREIVHLKGRMAFFATSVETLREVLLGTEFAPASEQEDEYGHCEPPSAPPPTWDDSDEDLDLPWYPVKGEDMDLWGVASLDGIDRLVPLFLSAKQAYLIAASFELAQACEAGLAEDPEFEEKARNALSKAGRIADP